MVNFSTVACRISSRLKWYKTYKNWLSLAKVIVKNKMSRFLCITCLCEIVTYHCYMWSIINGSQWVEDETWLQYIMLQSFNVQILPVVSYSSPMDEVNVWLMHPQSVKDLKVDTDQQTTTWQSAPDEVYCVQLIVSGNWHVLQQIMYSKQLVKI